MFQCLADISWVRPVAHRYCLFEEEFFDRLGLVGRADWKPRNEISQVIESEVTQEDTSRFTAVIIGLVYSKSASR